MSETMVLPEEKVKATVVNPLRTVIYSPPKMGKTTILSKLDNCLIIDLEQGARYVDALKVEVNSLLELQQLGEAIKAKGKPYKYIAIDTATKLEELCEGAATAMYKQSVQGKNFKGKSVLELANGGGYMWLRNAYKQWVSYVSGLAEHTILVCHLKDKIVDKKGTDVSVKDIDLTGKIKNITCSNADAIAYLTRDMDNNLIASFVTSEDVSCGSRCEHLKGREIILGEMQENGDVISHWNRIFIK